MKAIRLSYELSSSSGHSSSWYIFHSNHTCPNSNVQQNIGIIAASLPSIQPLFPFFNKKPVSEIKNISLPLDWPPTPISKPRSYFNKNFSRPYGREPIKDIESNAVADTQSPRSKGLEVGREKVDAEFRQSMQEFLLGMFPAPKPGLVRFERNGRLGHQKGDSEFDIEAWG